MALAQAGADRTDVLAYLQLGDESHARTIGSLRLPFGHLRSLRGLRDAAIAVESEKASRPDCQALMPTCMMMAKRSLQEKAEAAEKTAQEEKVQQDAKRRRTTVPQKNGYKVANQVQKGHGTGGVGARKGRA